MCVTVSQCALKQLLRPHRHAVWHLQLQRQMSGICQLQYESASAPLLRDLCEGQDSVSAAGALPRFLALVHSPCRTAMSGIAAPHAHPVPCQHPLPWGQVHAAEGGGCAGQCGSAAAALNGDEGSARVIVHEACHATPAAALCIAHGLLPARTCNWSTEALMMKSQQDTLG